MARAVDISCDLMTEGGEDRLVLQVGPLSEDEAENLSALLHAVLVQGLPQIIPGLVLTLNTGASGPEGATIN